MQLKKPAHHNDSYKVGDIILSPQQNQKYQILQKISFNKKSSQQFVSTFYEHKETFIVKKQSNKLYYIMKKFQPTFVDKPSSVKDLGGQSPKKEKDFIKEIRAKFLYHPNLLQIQDVFIEKLNKENSERFRYLMVIEEYCEQGDLAYFLKNQSKKNLKQNKKQSFNEKIIVKWLLQILLALEHLHFNKLTHQFLNSQNIYLTPLGNLKLNEFYLLNSITVPKQTKKNKQGSSLILEGYEPMLNEKKFKLNQKKDIHDFGMLISFLCNSRQPRDHTKKQPKTKGINHLPSPYSEDLDNIYLNCINVKKTAIQVKDILKTPYFLQVMRDFINDKKLNLPVFDRIPIKKYMIHKKTISPKIIKTKPKENAKLEDNKNDGKLPRIQKPKNSVKNLEKYETKPENTNDDKKAMRASLQKLKSKLEQNHKQKLSREKRVRKNSAQKKQQKLIQVKDKPKILTPISSSKGSVKNSLLPPPPALFKNKNNDSKSRQQTMESQQTGTKSSREGTRSRSGKKAENISRSQSNSPQKKRTKPEEFKLSPDITFGKKSIQNDSETPLLKLQPSPNSQMPSEMAGSKQSQLAKISQNLAKIFSDLKIRQDDDEQLSFELDEQEQEQLRLTLKEEKQAIQGEENLMKTYKGKFDQIICELQQKYQPNLETIIEKTMEWDSNDFFTNRELIKKLKLQQGQSLLPSSAFIEEYIAPESEGKEESQS